MNRRSDPLVSRAQRSTQQRRQVYAVCASLTALRSAALQTRDRYGPWRSRISGAPLRKSSALHRIRDTRQGERGESG
jgi:hypothetical protein